MWLTRTVNSTSSLPGLTILPTLIGKHREGLHRRCRRPHLLRLHRSTCSSIHHRRNETSITRTNSYNSTIKSISLNITNSTSSIQSPIQDTRSTP